MSEDDKLLKEAKKLAWEDRLAHKNWKVRNDANIDIATLCDSIIDPKDPRLKEFGNHCSSLSDSRYLLANISVFCFELIFNFFGGGPWNQGGSGPLRILAG